MVTPLLPLVPCGITPWAPGSSFPTGLILSPNGLSEVEWRTDRGGGHRARETKGWGPGRALQNFVEPMQAPKSCKNSNCRNKNPLGNAELRPVGHFLPWLGKGLLEQHGPVSGAIHAPAFSNGPNPCAKKDNRKPSLERHLHGCCTWRLLWCCGCI